MASQMISRAMEENLHCRIKFIPADRAGMVVDDREDLLLVDSGLPGDRFNGIARARLRDAEADCRIREALRHFRQAGRPFSWWVGPCSRPRDLEGRLAAEGLRVVCAAVGMSAGPAPLEPEADPPEGLEVRRVRTVADLAAFCAALAEGDPSVGVYYGGAAPLLLRDGCPLKLFAGFLQGIAAGSSELFVCGGVAGIYSVSAPDCVMRMAMARAALWEARRLGVATVVVQAPEEAHEEWERLGFAPKCRFAVYQ